MIFSTGQGTNLKYRNANSFHSQNDRAIAHDFHECYQSSRTKRRERGNKTLNDFNLRSKTVLSGKAEHI